MGILKKHGNDNYLDNNFRNFEERLTRGSLRIEAIPSRFLYGSHCEDCDEAVTALKYKGRRILLHEASGKWILHQCPHPQDKKRTVRYGLVGGGGILMEDGETLDDLPEYVIGPDEGHAEPTAEEEIDWHERADIEQEQKAHQWPDDPYNYPDIPYVAPGDWK